MSTQSVVPGKALPAPLALVQFHPRVGPFVPNTAIFPSVHFLAERTFERSVAAVDQLVMHSLSGRAERLETNTTVKQLRGTNLSPGDHWVCIQGLC